VERGTLFGIPTYQWIAAKGKVRVRYAIFLAEIPAGFQGVANVEKKNAKVVITERVSGRSIVLP